MQQAERAAEIALAERRASSPSLTTRRAGSTTLGAGGAAATPGGISTFDAIELAMDLVSFLADL